MDIVNSTLQTPTEPGRPSVATFVEIVQVYFDKDEAMTQDCSPHSVVRKEGNSVVVCWECTGAKGTNQFVNALDRLIALVPFLNRSATKDKLVDDRERIHSRIVCSINEILIKDDFGVIVGIPAMGRIGEAEKMRIVRDCINLNRKVFDLLNGVMRESCREVAPAAGAQRQVSTRRSRAENLQDSIDHKPVIFHGLPTHTTLARQQGLQFRPAKSPRLMRQVLPHLAQLEGTA